MSLSNANPCSSTSPGRARGLWRIGTPVVLLCGASALFSVAGPNAPLLAAGGAQGARPDMDGDGLIDVQEIVLGTSPDLADTDLDGYSDLEELARRSDPLDILSVPGTEPLSIGMYAHSEGGVIQLSTAVFIKGGDPSGLRFDLGVVLGGVPIVLGTSSYQGPSKAFLYASRLNPQNKLVVLETPIPEPLVARMGELHMYATIADTTSTGLPPSAAVASLVDFSGETTLVEPSPDAIQGGTGIVFRPLKDKNELPSSWTAGQMCWQNAAPVGTNGSNTTYEIEAASCEEFDSSCSASDCSASVGSTFEMPDPGVLVGG